MEGIIEKLMNRYCSVCRVGEANKCDYFYVILRVTAGLLVMQYGAQKLFGSFGGGGVGVEVLSAVWFAGVIELFGGLALVLGFFTRLAAMLLAVLMVIIFFYIHWPIGVFPILNGGDLSLVFFALFLFLTRYGAKCFSLERILLKREIF